MCARRGASHPQLESSGAGFDHRRNRYDQHSDNTGTREAR